MRYRFAYDDSGHGYAIPVDEYWPANDDEFEEFEIPASAIRMIG